ncbi:Protein of unknown function [Lactobacillus delbrueckii subsp. lactis]|nr:Putative uncharacterized protein [Lactobacillus delbrueckii subsp. lactis]CDR83298.1 Protein of unknown function [Lactobacillus delbrueckii subsp. lactis]
MSAWLDAIEARRLSESDAIEAMRLSNYCSFC